MHVNIFKHSLIKHIQIMYKDEIKYTYPSNIASSKIYSENVSTKGEKKKNELREKEKHGFDLQFYA